VRDIANVVLKVLYKGLKLRSDEKFQEISAVGIVHVDHCRTMHLM
jgi:hypothetical protein